MNRELNRLKSQACNNVNELKQKLNNDLIEKHLDEVQGEYNRISEIAHHAPAIIENLDKQLKEKTKLSNSDVSFLFLCTAIQCARQYLLTNEKLRLSARQGDDLMEGTVGNIVPPKWQDILLQSVPYDAIQIGEHVTKSTNLSGTTHRFRTLGHDPVLGWIFGTANIMTNSLSKTNFETYQVKDMKIVRHYPMGVVGMLKKSVENAQKDKLLLPTAIVRQAIHFGSDYFTKQGLPVPVVATVNNDVAKAMIMEGNIDMWSISRGTAISTLINHLIAVIHRLFYRPESDGSPSQYEVRTRKILGYSNVLATGSNSIVVAFTKDLTKLDVGGIIATLHRIISDYSFIQKIKRDFLKNEFYNIVVGNPYQFLEE